MLKSHYRGRGGNVLRFARNAPDRGKDALSERPFERYINVSACDADLKYILRKIMSKWDYGGHISLYFNKTFHTIWQGLEHRVYMYIYEHPDWDIWIGGHSLGGALATLATFFLVHSKLVQPDAVKLMTFGQPRVGDKAFADAFDNEVGYAYRVVHSRDIVPSIPRSGYWHQGAEGTLYYNCEERKSRLGRI
ncbi:triacylglycerol lipase [Ancylostoma ceylanicum]|uniref:Triacylglycerol lipase n=1 Tax=Ancylostoma ceylanicum TaxID=53326 RepID=A0A0D6MBF2_9BILA|nr:triacylglycerol lipase [Ancylostoma ceylanicum]